MNIEIKKISKKQAEKFYNNLKTEKTFLQSLQFAKFRENLGETVFLKGIFSKNKLIGTVLIQKIKTRIKTFLHMPHGPLINAEFHENLEFWNLFLESYKNLGQAENCDFIRISPLISNENKVLKNSFKTQKFQDAAVHLVNPEKTWILDISKDEEILLKEMKKSTRYEVNRREKQGIEVVTGNDEKNFAIFWDLHMETVKRQKFIPFSKKSTRIELDIFGENCLIFNGQTDQKFYSSAIIIFDNKSAYYHQGASIYSKKPVSHAVLWSAILEAKKRGCTEFNFWGVCDANEKKHPWFGLSKFKRGFGGEERNYIHCQDFPLTTKYWLSRGIEKYRRWKRGY
jgi:lipid II:glycine glycyltransferase (peptidoglycan interpeptide bridge formation enzyme)